MTTNRPAMQIEIGARLKAFILEEYGSQTSFAAAIGVTQGFVSQMVNGNSGIPIETLVGILFAKPRLNVRWLLTGDGEMFFEKKSDGGAGGEVLVLEEDGEEYRAGGNPLIELGAMLEQILKNQKDLEREVERLKKEKE